MDDDALGPIRRAAPWRDVGKIGISKWPFGST
jgi:hypothetical protein